MNANLAQSRQDNPVHFRTQNYCSLMLGYQKGNMTEKPQKNSKKRQRIVLKRLVKQRKHIFLWRERVSKNQENIKRNHEARNILKKGEVFGRNGRVRISAVYFKGNFSHSIPQVTSATFRKVVFTEQRNKTSSASQY